MSEDVVDLGVFHERMIERIKTHFGNEVEHVAAYERFEKTLPSPLVIVELEESPPDEPDNLGTTQLQCGLDFAAYVVVSGFDEAAELKVRQLAMSLKSFLNRNNFGMAVEWPKVGAARDAEFEWPRSLAHANEYVIWKVEFSFAGVLLGENCWEGMR